MFHSIPFVLWVKASPKPGSHISGALGTPTSAWTRKCRPSTPPLLDPTLPGEGNIHGEWSGRICWKGPNITIWCFLNIDSMLKIIIWWETHGNLMEVLQVSKIAFPLYTKYLGFSIAAFRIHSASWKQKDILKTNWNEPRIGMGKN